MTLRRIAAAPIAVLLLAAAAPTAHAQAYNFGCDLSTGLHCAPVEWTPQEQAALKAWEACRQTARDKYDAEKPARDAKHAAAEAAAAEAARKTAAADTARKAAQEAADFEAYQAAKADWKAIAGEPYAAALTPDQMAAFAAWEAKFNKFRAPKADYSRMMLAGPSFLSAKMVEEHNRRARQRAELENYLRQACGS